MMSFERPDERIAVDLDRIEMEIVMNCYDEVEQASGWYCSTVGITMFSLGDLAKLSSQ